MPRHLVASCLLLAFGLNMSLAAIHKRSGANSLGVDPEGKPAANPAVSVENTDLLDKLSWKCANNASCLYGVANGLMASYRRGETLKLGLFDLVKLPELDASRKHKWGTGRGLSGFMDFVTGNAIRVPVGPMVFSVQRAEDDSDYIEVALLKKTSSSTGNHQRRGSNQRMTYACRPGYAIRARRRSLASCSCLACDWYLNVTSLSMALKSPWQMLTLGNYK